MNSRGFGDLGTGVASASSVMSRVLSPFVGRGVSGDMGVMHVSGMCGLGVEGSKMNVGDLGGGEGGCSGGTEAMRNFAGERRGEGGTLLRSSKGRGGTDFALAGKVVAEG